MFGHPHRRRRLWAALRSNLPHGRGLPEPLWESRHTWMLRILWLHIPALVALGYGFGYSLGEAVQYASPIFALALLGTYTRTRRFRALLVALGLLTCSALIVHLTGGLIESHFHFFVMLTVLAFYEDWAVYGLAGAFIVLHHGIIGAMAPEHDVFQHDAYPDVSPWVWVGVHFCAISCAALANVLLWRMNERSRASVSEEAQRAAHAEAVAGTLSASLTPDPLPELAQAGVVSARYLPGEGEIGGDFYEVLCLPDGRIGIGLGDVAGHGVQAAALTAKLRYTLRGYALDGCEPAEVMDKLERALGLEGSATCAYLIVDPGRETVTGSLAGHLPPAMRLPDGTVELLTGGLSVPLAALGRPHQQHTQPMPAGATLVVYSDGLIERRGESIDLGLQRLCDAVADTGGDPRTLCEELPVQLLSGQRQSDDIALVALRTSALRSPVGTPALPLVALPGR